VTPEERDGSMPPVNEAARHARRKAAMEAPQNMHPRSFLLIAVLLIGCSAAAPTSVPSGGASAVASDVGVSGCSADSRDLGDMTGVWAVEEEGLYYLRHMGDCVWWFGTSLRDVSQEHQSGFANVAVGRIVGQLVHVEWADLTLGDHLGGGTLVLRITENGDRLVREAQTGTGFGGMTWTRREPSPGTSPSGGGSGPTSPSASR
jgi:hypothetical protein